MDKLKDDARLALSARVRWRAVGDEGVLVHLDQGRVVVVNGVGLHIVRLLATPMARADLVAAIVAAFEVTRDQAAADLDQFLAELDAEQALARPAA